MVEVEVRQRREHYEYCEVKCKLPHVVQQCNEHDRRYWELVSIVPQGDYMHLFMRRLVVRLDAANG